MGVEEALAFLQKKSTTNGDSVFLHLSQLIQHVLETKADDAVDLLETSMLLKQTRLLLEDNAGFNLEGRTPDEEKIVQTFLELFNVATKPPPDLDALERAQEEGTDGETNADVADFLSESTNFETVGVGVGRTESYYIVLALKQLGSKPGISKVRFFGKFFGIHGNYYVFETNKQQEDDHTEAEEETKHTEFGRPVESIPQEREGTNVYAYWVCSRLGEAFIQLPDVTPLQIQTARSLTKFLTGNLNVLTSPVRGMAFISCEHT